MARISQTEAQWLASMLKSASTPYEQPKPNVTNEDPAKIEQLTSEIRKKLQK